MASNVLRSRLLSSSRALGVCSARALPRLAGAPSGAALQLSCQQRFVAVQTQLRSLSLSHSVGSSRGMALIIRAAATEASASAKVLFEPASLPAFILDTSSLAGAWEGDLLVVSVAEDDFKTEGDVTTIVSESLKEADAASGGAITDCVAAGGFEGKQGQQSKVIRVGSAPGLKVRQIALVGVGKGGITSVTSEWGLSTCQALGNAVAGLAKTARAARVGVLAMHKPESEADVPAAVTQIATGVLLGGWEGTRFKSKTPPTLTKLAEVHLLPRIPFSQAPTEAMSAMASNLKPSIDKAVAVAQGTLLTRYLVEAPPNVCTPEHIANAAAHIAAQAPSTCTLRVLEKAECEAMNMGLYLGVSAASDLPPKFIHLTYTSPGDGPKKKIALVGKGVTFDSGGYNIKAGPGSMIEMMKFDMGGSAATLGAARIIAALSPPGIEAHFIVPACENMVSGKGMRPGDVLTSANGKTVEINNTDAEGRLTLADAMWYAQEKCGATSMIDTATLTGAIIVALGTDIAGFYTPSEAMASSFTAAAKATGEKVWRMPLEMGYFEQFKSSCADMKNAGSRWGGSISAATFLKQFVNEGVEWAHLDMAGPVWDEKAGLPTGYGAATLAQWAISQADTK